MLELPNFGESTVRFFKKRHLDELLISSGEIDDEVQKFIRALRKAGTPINTTVVLAAAEGIVVSKDRT